MADGMSPQLFHAAGWRVVREDASAHFRTESLVAGIALAEAVGRLADGANVDPDIDLRANGVTVRLGSPAGRQSLDASYVRLAEQISEAARELGITVDPTRLQTVQIAIDALVIPDVMPFWRAVLGYQQVDEEDLIDPLRQGPPFWFQQMDAQREQRNRIHVDLYVPQDQAEARVAAAIAAGGHLVSDENAPEWWTLADAEGNEVDVAPWPDRD